MRKCLLCCIALALCLAFLFPVSVCAGGIAVDGYIQPAEWERTAFSTLFASETESGCAVSYADFRAVADVDAKRVYFALQVVDEAFTGSGSLSRVQIGFDGASFSFTADGAFQATGGGHTVQAAGIYQGGYNRDYVLEAVIICPQALRGGKLPVSVWFTDGAGRRSAVCELTVDTGVLEESTLSTAPTASQTASSATEPRPSASTPPASVQPTRWEESSAGVAHSTVGGHTATPQESRTQSTARDTAAQNPGAGARPWPETGAHGTAGVFPAAQPRQASTEGEPAALPPEEVAIPETGETGAGNWSAKRIAACAMAGACVLAAALLFVMQARKKEKPDEPQG